MPAGLPELSRDELFDRLAAGEAARITLVTPNRRLAQTLAAEFDRRQEAAGRTVWETADVLPYGAFVERLYDDALHSEAAAGLPLLLGPDQEQSLWEEVVRHAAGGLLAVPETAALAREAWAIAHAWDLADGLPGALAGEDAVAFAGWARAYAARTGRERFTDRARLATVVADVLDERRVKKPGLLVAYALDVVTPQQAALFEALAARGVTLARSGPPPAAARAVRIACADAAAEFRLAGRWARARLEADPDARIGIVVPELHRHKRRLRRALAEGLDPGRAGGVRPFNVSLGDPLADFPLVAHALAALALAGRGTAFEEASLVIRSPFLAAADADAQGRARLDAWLRRHAEPAVALDRLAAAATRAGGVLGERLRAYAAFRKARLLGAQSPAEWARAFGEALAVLGFPGERGLDSNEFQALEKWHELLARLATLERVVPRMGFEAALARVRRMAAETVFQPETPAVPVQVLGVLEAAGMRFDHLWVAGLTDEAWPAVPHPHPFIPPRLQQTAGLPSASPATALEFARRVTAEWLGGGGEVVLSHPLCEGDRDLGASPLVREVPAAALALPEFGTWRDAIHASRALERVPDAQAPALAAEGTIRGGAGLLKDQAACPFRAFAARRLAARPLDAPHAGLDAAERGTLVHRVLEGLWRKLGSKRALDALGAAERDALIALAVDRALAGARDRRPATLAGRFAAIERERLARLAREWLDLERTRGDFIVLPVEDRRTVSVGPLALDVRLDRVDETAAGERVVIDYKTGPATLGALLRPRLEEPQLPLYATAAEPGAAAAAFAQVRPGEMKFVGLARAEGILPDVRPPADAARNGARADWADQVAFWRRELETLAAEFAAGRAEVAPRRGLETCRECGLQPLCRVHERIAAPGDGE